VKRNLFVLLSLLVIASVLTACGGAPATATEAPPVVTEPPATEAPATEEPTEAPATEAPATEAPSTFDGMSVAAPDCDYGGKISSIEATDQLTVVFNLCKPDPAFLAKVAFTPFGIQPSEYIESTGGGGDILERPIGTGPYILEEWARGDSITYRRFDDYWGEPAIAETAVLRWATEGAARLQELQSGTVDLITNVSPDDFETVSGDPNLQLITDPNPNVFYLGMTNTHPPFDNIQVRQAVAMGIDRQRIIDNFYPEGSEVPGYFTPCSIPNGCEGDPWYDFDPEAARALLAEAGFPDGFETSIYYRDVFRVYLPEPGLVAVELQTQLRDNLGIDAEVVVMESGEFIAESGAGNLAGLHLLGWGADYPHVTNFLDFHFGQANTQFGNSYPEIYEHLQEASQIGDTAEAAPLYANANNAIREQVPMVPIAHGVSADAALASLGGVHARPFGAYVFALLDPGDDTLVVMQNAEPISLYCADETDGESLTACQQVVETLYDYELDSGETVPELATSCEPNEDSTVWTCTLREGVKFHDGSDFDANDVVASWAAGIDAENPNHTGNTGTFFYYEYLWDSFINPAPQ
jgi:peptide/nickel transport system substrate-binding protein